MKIIEIIFICHYRRGGYSYFRSLFGDRIKLSGSDFKRGGKYKIRMEVKDA